MSDEREESEKMSEIWGFEVHVYVKKKKERKRDGEREMKKVSFKKNIEKP